MLSHDCCEFNIRIHKDIIIKVSDKCCSSSEQHCAMSSASITVNNKMYFIIYFFSVTAIAYLFMWCLVSCVVLFQSPIDGTQSILDHCYNYVVPFNTQKIITYTQKVVWKWLYVLSLGFVFIKPLCLFVFTLTIMYVRAMHCFTIVRYF